MKHIDKDLAKSLAFDFYYDECSEDFRNWDCYYRDRDLIEKAIRYVLNVIGEEE